MSMIRGDFRPPPMKYIKGLRDLFKYPLEPPWYITSREEVERMMDYWGMTGTQKEKTMPSSDEVMTPEEQPIQFKGTVLQVNRHETAYNVLVFRVLIAMGNSKTDDELRKDLIKALTVAAGELA